MTHPADDADPRDSTVERLVQAGMPREEAEAAWAERVDALVASGSSREEAEAAVSDLSHARKVVLKSHLLRKDRQYDRPYSPGDRSTWR